MSSCPAVSLVVGPVVFLHVSWGSQHLRRTLAHTKFRIGWALEAILAWLWGERYHRRSTHVFGEGRRRVVCPPVGDSGNIMGC